MFVVLSTMRLLPERILVISPNGDRKVIRRAKSCFPSPVMVWARCV